MFSTFNNAVASPPVIWNRTLEDGGVMIGGVSNAQTISATVTGDVDESIAYSYNGATFGDGGSVTLRVDRGATTGWSYDCTEFDPAPIRSGASVWY